MLAPFQWGRGKPHICYPRHFCLSGFAQLDVPKNADSFWMKDQRKLDDSVFWLKDQRYPDDEDKDGKDEVSNDEYRMIKSCLFDMKLI